MSYVSFTDLRNNLAKHLDQVVADRTEVVVSRRNGESVVMMALSEFEGWKETVYLLSNPANARHLADSIAELDAGGSAEHALLDE